MVTQATPHAVYAGVFLKFDKAAIEALPLTRK
jgi:hypothetical protein